jgi:hypothetical protein
MRDSWMLRACFYLLSIVVVGQVITIMAGGATCYYLFIVKQAEVGACQTFTTVVREVWAEALAAVLALLLAARGGPPDPPSPGGPPPDGPPDEPSR